MSVTAPTLENENYYKSGFPKDVKRTKFDLTINAKLKEARKKRGYSLAKVVALLKEKGVSTGVATIQGYEAPESNVNHRYPSLHMLKTLIELYDCSADFIFDNSEEIERANYDMFEELHKIEKMKWQGQEITQAQRGLILEKIREIMSI